MLANAHMINRKSIKRRREYIIYPINLSFTKREMDWRDMLKWSLGLEYFWPTDCLSNCFAQRFILSFVFLYLAITPIRFYISFIYLYYKACCINTIKMTMSPTLYLPYLQFCHWTIRLCIRSNHPSHWFPLHTPTCR